MAPIPINATFIFALRFLPLENRFFPKAYLSVNFVHIIPIAGYPVNHSAESLSGAYFQFLHCMWRELD
jgi:hypothetical protein